MKNEEFAAAIPSAGSEELRIKSEDKVKELTTTQNIIFLAGAVLMVAGAGASLLAWSGAPYCYAVGAIAFASMQMLQRYEGSNFTIRRLRRIMLISDVLFLVTAVLMFANQGNALGLSQTNYVKYIHNNWVVTLLIAAILQLYTSHRMGHELAKEAKKL